MKIKELYDSNETITVESYLAKNGVLDIKDFFNPTGIHLDNYFDYKSMSEAVDIFNYHRLLNDGAYILCDSGDTDGITSTVILYDYMTKLNEDWDIKILIHEGKQRGLKDEELFNKILNNPKGLLIIPDSGTNDKEQLNELYEKTNLDCIVLDHHSYETPIEKGCLVNNKDENSNVSRNGSGCLVTHKFLQALDVQYDKKWSGQYIDMVSLSLISDSMPMFDEQNRTYYYYGLQYSNLIHNKFLKAMFDNFIGDKPYTQKDISFKIIPKINSICRSKNQELKQKLILSFLGLNDIDEMLSLCAENHELQTKTVDNIIKENEDNIEKLKNNNLIIFTDDNMPQSYSGLVSAKIMNKCNGKPTICGKIKDGILIGSLRSPIPLRKELNDNKYVNWAQGHENSCGISIDENNIQNLIDYYNSLNVDYEPYITVLKSYSIKSIPKRLYGLFEPYNEFWGKDLPKPIFHITNIKFNPKDVAIIGKDKRTIKITSDDIELVIFNCLRKDKENLLLGYYENDVFVSEPKNKNMVLECIGILGVNKWNGKEKLQIIIEDYEVKELQKRTINSVF